MGSQLEKSTLSLATIIDFQKGNGIKNKREKISMQFEVHEPHYLEKL